MVSEGSSIPSFGSKDHWRIAMLDEDIRQTIIDEEHLKLLSIGYMVSAGMSAFCSIFGVLYGFMGVMMGTVFNAKGETTVRAGQAPPAFIGRVFAIIEFAIFLLLITLAVLKLLTALRIKHRRSRIFCMVVAGISCFGIPYSTLLGIFTFIVLGRDSVRRLFESRAAI